MESFFVYTITGVVIAIIMYFLNTVSKAKPIQTMEGDEVFKLPLFYGILGIIAFAAGLWILIYGLINYNPEEFLWMLISCVFIGGLGGLLILQQWVSKVILTENEIIKVTMSGKNKILAWGEITEIKFNAFSSELKVKSKNTSIKCHMHLVGFPSLVEKLEMKTGITKKQMGFAGV